MIEALIFDVFGTLVDLSKERLQPRVVGKFRELGISHICS